MRNKISSILFLSLLLAVLIFAAGCTTKTTTETTGQQSQQQETSGNYIDLTNTKNLADLLKLGFGIVCDVDYEHGTTKGTLKYYIKSIKYKIEGNFDGRPFAYLRPNDGYFYMKMPSEIEFRLPQNLNCEWLKFKETQAAEVESSGIKTEAAKIDTPVDKIKWKCYKQHLDDSIFNPPANACDFEKLFANLPQFPGR